MMYDCRCLSMKTSCEVLQTQAAESHEAGSARCRLHDNSSDSLREITDFRDDSICQWEGGYYPQSIGLHNNGTDQ